MYIVNYLINGKYKGETILIRKSDLTKEIKRLENDKKYSNITICEK